MIVAKQIFFFIPDLFSKSKTIKYKNGAVSWVGEKSETGFFEIFLSIFGVGFRSGRSNHRIEKSRRKRKNILLI